jgi:putative lipoic acid-binding regulatory protein
MNLDDQKVCIEYPCRWCYKVIGSDETEMRAAIVEVTAGACEITLSRSSATGKYLALNVTVQVGDEKTRIAVYEALCREPSVKLVL